MHNILFPLTVLGPGRRIGIWFQGCTIHCKECLSPESWEFRQDLFISFSDLKVRLEKFQEFDPDGVTISGGEPFDQPDGLLILLNILNKLNFNSIMVYSGYKFSYLQKKYSPYLNLIDLLISEPFILDEKDTKLWRGSDNQKIHVLSPRAKKIYNEFEFNNARYTEQRPLQIKEDNHSIFIIGIPKRCDLERIREFSAKYQKSK